MLKPSQKMNAEIDSTLYAYWNNEAKIAALALSLGSTVDEIVEKPYKVSPQAVLDLKNLLLRKRSLLNVLGSAQRRETAALQVVDLSTYRRLAPFRTG